MDAARLDALIPAMPRAAIDLGSNSALLLVLADDGRVLVDDAEVVGLGRGLGDGGPLADDRQAAAIAVLARYAARAEDFGVAAEDVRAVTTSAVRRATNASAFLDAVRAATGLRLRCISGDSEAVLTFRGATSDAAAWLDAAADVVVIDVGGGSTEVVAGRLSVPEGGGSLEVGSVRLTERHLGRGVHDPAGLLPLRDEVAAALATLDPLPAAAEVIGVAGTVTTLLTVARGHRAWAPERVHGAWLEQSDLRRIVQQLLPLTPEARRAAVPVSPERADHLVAGAALLDVILEHLGTHRLRCSLRGLRWGLLAEA